MRIVKIEVPVYRYAELSDSAKEAAKSNILSITRNAQDFTDSVKHTLDVLGIEKAEVYYSLGNCQGDGLSLWVLACRLRVVYKENRRLNISF